MMMTRIATAMALSCLCACQMPYPLTLSTKAKLTPKSPNCTFQVTASPVDGTEYEEIARVNGGAMGVSSSESFRKSVQRDVCRVGGDVVVTHVNEYGYIYRGVILRRRKPL
jgi:hypothetical protein